MMPSWELAEVMPNRSLEAPGVGNEPGAGNVGQEQDPLLFRAVD